MEKTENIQDPTLIYCGAGDYGVDEFRGATTAFSVPEVPKFVSNAKESVQKSSNIITFYDEMGAPVPGVNIYSKDNPGSGTITDQNGIANLSRFAPDEVLTISHVSFVNYDVRRDGLTTAQTLFSETNALDEVLIVADKKKFPFWVLGVLATGVVLMFGAKEPTAALNAPAPQKKKTKRKKKAPKRIHV